MFVSCWSAKGGSGTTVVSVALALVMARSERGEVLLVDLGGDVPAVLGMPEPTGPGLTDWLAAGAEVPADGLARIEVPAAPNLGVLPRGRGVLGPLDRVEILTAMLAGESRVVVADVGCIDATDAAPILVASATQSLLITRPCYLALRRVVAAPIRPSGLVVVTEPGRALSAVDVESVVGVPVLAEIACDPAVARAVDAGLLASRLPRGLERALRRAA